MASVGIKLDSGWFIWSNNKCSFGLVRKRLDKFFASAGWLQKVSFLATRVIRQANSDHD